MTHVHRLAAVIILAFALLSIGADGGCGWDQKANDFSNPTTTCCPAGSQRYICGVQVALNEVQMPDVSSNNPPKTDVRCFAAPPVCAADLNEAQNRAMGYAQLQYGGAAMNVVTMQTTTCRVIQSGCGDGGITVQDFEGTCMFIEPAGIGGSSTTTTAACVANTDLCSANTDCCSGICSENGACESCRAMLEGCTQNSECCSGICSLNACGGTGLPPHHLGGM
jgi:hypothetical protein